MKSDKFSLKWKDALNAVIIMLIGNLLVAVMSAAEDTLPTWHDLYIVLINSIKLAVIPYLLKNFFTDSVKDAYKTVEKAETKAAVDNS